MTVDCDIDDCDTDRSDVIVCFGPRAFQLALQLRPRSQPFRKAVPVVELIDGSGDLRVVELACLSDLPQEGVVRTAALKHDPCCVAREELPGHSAPDCSFLVQSKSSQNDNAAVVRVEQRTDVLDAPALREYVLDLVDPYDGSRQVVRTVAGYLSEMVGPSQDHELPVRQFGAYRLERSSGLPGECRSPNDDQGDRTRIQSRISQHPAQLSVLTPRGIGRQERSLLRCEHSIRMRNASTQTKPSPVRVLGHQRRLFSVAGGCERLHRCCGEKGQRMQ